MSYTERLTDTTKQDLREITFWVAEQSRNIEIAKSFVCWLRDCIKNWKLSRIRE